jgi:hypothetical protein
LGISFFLLLTENKYPYEIVGPRALVCDIRGALICEIRILLELRHIKTKKASKRYDLSLKPLVGAFRNSFFIKSSRTSRIRLLSKIGTWGNDDWKIV